MLSALLIGCGHPTQLVEMSLNPTTATVIGRGVQGQVQFTAYGRFIHPDETRDISTQVTWTSSIPDVATVDSKGLVTSGLACGSTTITATAGRNLQGVGSDSNIRTAIGTFVVADPNDPLCPKGTQ
jgi:uncharacterized protein YjdB